MIELEERDYTQFDVQQEAREMLVDYPDLRVSVNDVSAFQGGRRPQTFQVNLPGPTWTSSRSTPTQLIAGLKKRAGDSSTSTRPSRSASPRSRCSSTARRPATWACRSARSPTRSASSSAACRSRKFRDGDEQYDVWLRAEAERPRDDRRTSTS